MNNENKVAKINIRLHCKNKDELIQIGDAIKNYSKDVELIEDRRKSRDEYKIRGKFKLPLRNNILIINTKCLDLKDKLCTYLKSIEANYTVTH